ncbi:MAG: polysaccharide deacetylase family protein [Planctomycetes bacterium]|nr:polysaccharide deacetylase family protein [Planctomycetota bacterium]
MSINLLYHDVTESGADDASGFAGPEAARYKLTPEEFSRHLDRIANSVTAPALASATDLSSGTGWSITFDDGGVSAITTIAAELELRNWRGWFFIATDFIDQPGFCTQAQLRQLHQRGHVIGSHSCSHPERISSCSWSQLVDEWSRSCKLLAEIVEEPIKSGSVPGGFYSPDVARAASEAGIKLLFNSEPTTGEFEVQGCRILGRYNVYRGMSADDASSLLSSPLRRWRQSAFWSAKKAAKTVAGPIYKAVRKHLLSQVYKPHSAAP